MNSIGDEIREMVKSQFGSVAEFARIMNVSEQTLSTILGNSNFEGARAKTVATIAKLLELDPYWLTNGKIVSVSTRFKGYTEVPLCGSIAAGTPIEAIQTDDRFPIPQELADRYPHAFLLRVSGTSMSRVLPDGCYALIEPDSELTHPGQPYAVTVGTADATIKRVRKLANGLRLEPDSADDPTWKPHDYDYETDSEEICLIGRVVWYTLPLNWRFD